MECPIDGVLAKRLSQVPHRTWARTPVHLHSATHHRENNALPIKSTASNAANRLGCWAYNIEKSGCCYVLPLVSLTVSYSSIAWCMVPTSSVNLIGSRYPRPNASETLWCLFALRSTPQSLDSAESGLNWLRHGATRWCAGLARIVNVPTRIPSCFHEMM